MNTKKIYFNKVAFPHEHGSWGFFLEPIILALVISFSYDGLLIAISSFVLFLANQPASIIVKKTPKYLLHSAYLLLIIYLFIAFSLVGLVILHNRIFYFLVPYVIAITIMLFYKAMEVRNLNRHLIVELLAPIAVLFIAVSILMKNNWNELSLIAFSFVLLSRSIQTVFYINNKLRFFKGHGANRNLVNVIGLFFFVALIVFANLKLSPYLSVLALVILMLRAYLGLLPKNKNEKVKIVGIKEFIYGFLFVIINVLGYLLRL